MPKNTTARAWIYLASIANHDGTNYGPGTIQVSKDVATALIDRGRAVATDAPKEAPAAPAPATGTQATEKTLADFSDDDLKAEAQKRFGSAEATRLEDLDDATVEAEYQKRFSNSLGTPGGDAGTEGDQGGTDATSGATAATTAPATGTELPEDFPGRQALAEAGLTTVEAVRAHDFDKDAVAGVGDVTKERIRARLAG